MTAGGSPAKMERSHRQRPTLTATIRSRDGHQRTAGPCHRTARSTYDAARPRETAPMILLKISGHNIGPFRDPFDLDLEHLRFCMISIVSFPATAEGRIAVHSLLDAIPLALYGRTFRPRAEPILAPDASSGFASFTFELGDDRFIARCDISRDDAGAPVVLRRSLRREGGVELPPLEIDHGGEVLPIGFEDFASCLWMSMAEGEQVLLRSEAPSSLRSHRPQGAWDSGIPSAVIESCDLALQAIAPRYSLRLQDDRRDIAIFDAWNGAVRPVASFSNSEQLALRMACAIGLSRALSSPRTEATLSARLFNDDMDRCRSAFYAGGAGEVVLVGLQSIAVASGQRMMIVTSSQRLEEDITGGIFIREEPDSHHFKIVVG